LPPETRPFVREIRSLKTIRTNSHALNMTAGSGRLALPLAALLLAAALSGCGGGGGGGSVACDTITGGASSVSSTGPASNPGRAADGDLGSYGALVFSPSGSGTIRATAQDGVVFPAGSRVGAFVSFLSQSGSNATSMRTYLDGILIETGDPATGFFDPTYGDTAAGFYVGFEASAPFDAVEFAEVTSGGTQTSEYRVYEICSDGHV
jgi:hypothetical protein